MKFLVAGGTGFIGTRLLELFNKRGYEFIVTGRRESNMRLKNGIYIKMDMLDAEGLLSLKPLVANVDVIIHLASATPYATKIHDDPVSMIKANVVGLCNFLKLVPFIKGLKKLCYASTIDVYGRAKYLPTGEDHPTNPSSNYGISKLAAEMLLKKFCTDRGLPWIILRLTQIYGPGDTSNKLTNKVTDRVLEGGKPEIYGDGSDLRDLMYVDDAARALITSATSDYTGTYNVASGKTCSKGNSLLYHRTIRRKPYADSTPGGQECNQLHA